jgi:hypothetical protein
MAQAMLVSATYLNLAGLRCSVVAKFDQIEAMAGTVAGLKPLHSSAAKSASRSLLDSQHRPMSVHVAVRR